MIRGAPIASVTRTATRPGARGRRRNAAGPGTTAQRGFSYIEVLVAVIVIAVSLPPALDALSVAVNGADAHASQIARRYRASGRMEQVLAEPPAALDAAALASGSPAIPTSYSDPPGTPDRRIVFLARYDLDDADGDGDPFTGGDAGLIWVAVAIENTPIRLETAIGT